MGRRFIVEEIEDNPKKMGCGALIFFLLICIFSMSDSCEGEESSSDPAQVLQEVSIDSKISKEVQNEIAPQSNAINYEKLQKVIEEQVEVVKQQAEVETVEEDFVQTDAFQPSKEQKKTERKEKRKNRRKAKQSE